MEPLDQTNLSPSPALSSPNQELSKPIPRFHFKKVIILAVFMTTFTLGFLFLLTKWIKPHCFSCIGCYTEGPYEIPPQLLHLYGSPTPQPSQAPRSAPKLNTIRIYPSPNGEFSFYIYQLDPTMGDQCYYDLENRAGLTYSTNLSLPATIQCGEGPGYNFSKVFKGWTDDNRLIFDVEPGVVKVMSPRVKLSETITYDSSNLSLHSINRNLEYWLFVDNQGTYVLKNKNQQTIVADLPDSDFPPLYDEVNDGYIFIQREFQQVNYPGIGETNQTASVQIQFLDLGEAEVRTVLTTEPYPVEGRGCGPQYTLSRPGELILVTDCLNLDDKYLNADGDISIRL